jgi:hypothetical protein
MLSPNSVFYLRFVEGIIDIRGGGSEEAGHFSYPCNTTCRSSPIGTHFEHDFN